MTKARDLGVLDGDVVLFGGVYSNAQAFEAFLAEVTRLGHGVGNCICTGDIVAYCADPAPVTARMIETAIASIAGNCEQQLASAAPDCGCGFEEGTTCDLASKSWYAYASEKVDDYINFYAQLPDIISFMAHGKRYAVIHGGVDVVAKFIWPSDPDSVFRDEIARIEDIIGPVDGVIGGHCGIPFERVIDGKTWLNAGVIGMPPHDARPLTRFAILSQDGVRYHRLSYDHVAAAQAMVEAGLTQGYEIALQTGIWPAEDVLPAQLRR